MLRAAGAVVSRGRAGLKRHHAGLAGRGLGDRHTFLAGCSPGMLLMPVGPAGCMWAPIGRCWGCCRDPLVSVTLRTGCCRTSGGWGSRGGWLSGWKKPSLSPPCWGTGSTLVSVRTAPLSFSRDTKPPDEDQACHFPRAPRKPLVRQCLGFSNVFEI